MSTDHSVGAQLSVASPPQSGGRTSVGLLADMLGQVVVHAPACDWAARGGQAHPWACERRMVARPVTARAVAAALRPRASWAGNIVRARDARSSHLAPSGADRRLEGNIAHT